MSDICAITIKRQEVTIANEIDEHDGAELGLRLLIDKNVTYEDAVLIFEQLVGEFNKRRNEMV